MRSLPHRLRKLETLLCSISFVQYSLTKTVLRYCALLVVFLSNVRDWNLVPVERLSELRDALRLPIEYLALSIRPLVPRRNTLCFAYRCVQIVFKYYYNLAEFLLSVPIFSPEHSHRISWLSSNPYIFQIVAALQCSGLSVFDQPLERLKSVLGLAKSRRVVTYVTLLLQGDVSKWRKASRTQDISKFVALTPDVTIPYEPLYCTTWW